MNTDAIDAGRLSLALSDLRLPTIKDNLAGLRRASR